MEEGPLQLVLSAPESSPIELRASEVVLPGLAGVLTVLRGHTPLLTRLTAGALIAYDAGGGKRLFSVHEGFAEILHDRIVVLADVMERGEDIDLERAQAAAERARERLHTLEPNLDVARAEAALARGVARLQAHQGEEY